MNGDDVLSLVLAGLVLLLLAMIFINVLGGPRRGRRKRRTTQRWHEAGDSTGGVDPGPSLRPRSGRRVDGGGDDGGGNGGSDAGDSGGDGGGGGGGD